MKLAVVVDTFPRWSERFIARELSELLRRKIEFNVFCLKAGELPENDDEWNGLIDRRVVLPSCIIPRATNESNLSPSARKRRELVREELGLTAYAKIRCAEVLTTILRDQKFTHIHAHFASLPSTIAWLAAEEAQIPFSFSAHARDVFVDSQLLGEKIRSCTRVLTCHAHAREFLTSKFANTDKIALMRHGLELENFPFNPHKFSKPPKILAAGRFTPKKGFNDLIAAAADLSEHDFNLTLLGDGPDKRKLASKIRVAKMQRKISIAEPLSGDALRQKFADSDLFVAPYRTADDGDVDGVPNVILEAFALGLPVIGTNAGGLSEVLSLQTGIVVPENNPNSLATAIASCLKNPQIALDKTPAARALVERDYDIQKNIQPLIDTISI